MSEHSFRGQTVRPLSFGTSGLRGLVTDITDLEVWVNTTGFLRFLAAEQGLQPGTPVVVGGDMRPSTGRIMAAVARALADAGHPMRHAGRLPTPALALAGFASGQPSIVVTGSHIPFDRNGIKFNRADAEVSKSDEAPILARVNEARAEAYGVDPADSPFDDHGMLKAPVELPAIDPSIASAYIERYVHAFGADALAGAKVAVYQHSAVGRDLLVEVLERLGARVASVGRSETFVPVDTEAVDDAMVARIAALLDPARAALGGLDAVVSTDGDGDRPLLLAIDPSGAPRFVRGDTLNAMVSEDLDLDAVAIPVSVSDQVDKHLAHRGVELRRTRIGSPWVVAAMAEMDGVRRAGFEANGGFLLETAIDGPKGELQPLPTRDAILPMVSVLHASAQSGTRISDRVDALPGRFTTAGLVDEVAPPTGRAAIAAMRVEGPEQVWFRDPPHFMLPGEATRTATGDLLEALEKLRGHIEKTFRRLEVGALQHANWIDGARLAFDGGDVIHLRPSGNAPQFRVYVTADSMDRARNLVRACLDGDGPITRLLESLD